MSGVLGDKYDKTYYQKQNEPITHEVLGMQTDIFDGNLIRMKTGGYDEPDFEMTM